MYIVRFPSSLIRAKKKSVPEVSCASVVGQKLTLLDLLEETGEHNQSRESSAPVTLIECPMQACISA
jgi:hypothetical protein